jgi:hypothetical protein
MLDSLFKIVSEAGLSMNDPQVAAFLYDLNDMAGRTGCAVLLTHHFNQPDRKNKGPRIPTRHDIFGSTYFFNACSQCLLAWKNGPDDVSIKIEKDRNDSLGEGTILEFNTCAEDYSWHLRGLAGSSVRLDELQSAAEKVRAVLSSVKSEEALSVAEIALKVNSATPANPNSLLENRVGGMTPDHIRKVCSKLHDQGLIRRRSESVGRGRPSYLYFSQV